MSAGVHFVFFSPFPLLSYSLRSGRGRPPPKRQERRGWPSPLNDEKMGALPLPHRPLPLYFASVFFLSPLSLFHPTLAAPHVKIRFAAINAYARNRPSTWFSLLFPPSFPLFLPPRPRPLTGRAGPAVLAECGFPLRRGGKLRPVPFFPPLSLSSLGRPGCAHGGQGLAVDTEPAPVLGQNDYALFPPFFSSPPLRSGGDPRPVRSPAKWSYDGESDKLDDRGAGGPLRLRPFFFSPPFLFFPLLC